MNPAVDNLLALYERNASRDADVAWYANAKALARQRAADAGLPWRTYAAVVAATSPMQQWATKDGLRFPNLDAADRVVAWHHGQLDTHRGRQVEREVMTWADYRISFHSDKAHYHEFDRFIRATSVADERQQELADHPELDTDDRDVDLERELRLDEERIDAEMTRAELRGITPPSY